MCPAWRQVHLTRPASCTPARALQHSSQSLSKCAGATSTTISSAKSRFHNMRQVSPFMYACLPQKYDAQNRRTALASPHSHATCQPHRCQVRFCLQELQLPHKARSMYSLSSMELFFCNCLAMCSARCRLHMASLLSPSHSVTHVDPVVLALLRSSSFEVHVSAEGGSAPLCPTLNPYLPIKGVMGCKSGTLERPTTGDPTNRMLPSPPCIYIGGIRADYGIRAFLSDK